ncbi:hypothetical protein [Actinoplanes sp. G11-F43]|uniref:hypothetical protein n=1 Tax=Actinoplanes sp. G11-F43 TaxID=3424130 RepID=UPI003D329A12
MSDRAVLAAYPARIRRKYGAELIDTLMAMAAGGRPTRAEKGRLVLDGLHERFRPPVRSRFALVAAVLALLVGGAFGAAAGSWLGTFGYAALPDATALGQRVLPTEARGVTTDTYLITDGTLPAGTDVRESAESTRQKLAAEGWRVGPIVTGGDDRIADNVNFTAETDKIHLSVYAYPNADGEPYISLAGWPQRPAAYLPLTIAGALIGLVAGWLTGVALAHRIRAARRPLPSALLTGLGFALIVPPASGFVFSLVSYLATGEPVTGGGMVHDTGFTFGPTRSLLRAYDLGEGWILSPGDIALLPFWGFALIAIAAIAARRGRPEDQAIAA